MRRPVASMPVPQRVVLDEGTTLAMRHVADVLVVEVSGLADGRWSASLALELLARGPDERMVIDLNEVTLVDPGSLALVIHDLLAAGTDPHRVCLACERLSALVLLRRHGAMDQVKVFGSTSDALEASLLHTEGLGPGWVPSEPV